MRVAIGSQNPVKVEAVRLAFSSVWPEETWVFEGMSVSSGVSAQPMSDDEAIRGARNRARAARAHLNADFGVGLEGGIHTISDHSFDAGWIVVVDRSGREGIAATVKMPTPHKFMERIRQGKELGEIVDEFFGTVNAKQGDGHFGLMTKNIITRTSGYRDGVVAALARFQHVELFG